MVAVADAYDAMTSDRSYRTSRTVQGAVAELTACAGSQFDPAVVEAFVRMISQHHQDTDDLAAAMDLAGPVTGGSK